MTLVYQVIEAVFTIKTIHWAIGVVLVIIPDKGFVAVGVKNNRALVTHKLKRIGV